MKSKSVIYVIAGIVVTIFITSLIVNSCNEPKEDITNDIDKNGSIESSVLVEHINDSFDVLITRHKVWSNNSVSKDIYYRDTIPSLGKIYTTAENSEGDEQRVQVNKDYEVYITIK